MRHAKSDWSGEDGDDFIRPLNKRGRKSATALGNWLREKGYRPDLTLSSSSQRTRETFDGLKLDSPVRFENRLYLATNHELFDAINGADGDCLMVLAHNPGIALLARQLVAEPPGHDQFQGYPTGATLVADFDIPDWASLRAGTGTVVDFVVPRELVEAAG